MMRVSPGKTAQNDLRFKALFEAYAPRVNRLACWLLGDENDAKDAVQDVFIQVYRGLPDFRGESDISTWIFRIASNVCADYRRARRLETVPLKINDESYFLADPSRGPEEEFEHRKSRENVERLISRLPSYLASVISLYYLEGMNYAEIASVLRIPPGTVASRISRGRSALQALLTAHTEGRKP